MKIDPKAATRLATGGDAITNGLTRLTTVRGMRGAMSGGGSEEAPQGDAVDEGVDPAGDTDPQGDAILALGDAAGNLLLYAEETETAIEADKLLKKLDADVEPDEALVEAIEAAYGELPTVVQIAIDDLHDVDLATLTAAGEAMAEKGFVKDGVRWAVFLFLAHALSMQHSGDMGDEEVESLEEDAAETDAAAAAIDESDLM